MKITRIEQQGLKLTLCLADKGSMTLPELAEMEHLTEALTAKVMSKLRRGGIVTAVRGRVGGYQLVADPKELTIAAVFRALGRPIVEGCFNSGDELGDSPCHRVSECAVRPVWKRLEAEVTDLLDRITIKDLLADERTVRNVINQPRKTG